MEIVLVDDSKINNIINKTLIQRYSPSIPLKIFEDAEEALRYVSINSNLKLIFLDLNMPALNGWQFIELIKRNNFTHLKIFILTSSVDKRDETRALQEKIVIGFITKPLTKQDFQKIYEEHFL